MPIRKYPLITDYYYHLFNRSVAKIPIFTSKSDFSRIINILSYYRFKAVPFSFSKFTRLGLSQQESILKELKKRGRTLVDIVCFCLMPNHFHLLVKQNEDDGIIVFIRNVQNSYAKYFNLKYQRNGSLFQDRFKAIIIEDDSQLLHLSRYIHLNPFSSFIVKKIEDLIAYQWSSFPLYLSNDRGFCQPEVIFEQFKSSKDYKKFVFDQADYQRRLEEIKHIICDEPDVIWGGNTRC